MVRRLLSDWQLDAVMVVWPHAEMAAYRDCLGDLQSFYCSFLRELVSHERVVCIVPSDQQADLVGAATGLPEDDLLVGAVDDIWVRDFAPLPCEGGLVWTCYDPEYADTNHSRAVQSGFARCLGTHIGAAGEGRIHELRLVLEGGNVSHDGAGRVVACDKVLDRNGLATTVELLKALRGAVRVDQIALIPVEPDDPIGHADAVVRWLPTGHLVVNDYANQADPRYASYRRDLTSVLEAAFGPTSIVPIPYPLPRLGLDYPMDATGNYANFLMTRNRLYLPSYGIAEDEEASAILAGVTGMAISCVDATPLARQGGVLNCATWCFDSAALALPLCRARRGRPVQPKPQS